MTPLDPDDDPGNPDRGREHLDEPFILDCVVPDDPRELEADIAAYHRELRQAARKALLQRLVPNRWREQLGDTGPVVLLIVLGVTLIGSLASILAPHSDPPPRPVPLAANRIAGPDGVGGLLPASHVSLLGYRRPVRDLRPAVLALVPAQCACAAELEAAAKASASYRVRLYIVGDRSQLRDLHALAVSVGNGTIQVVVDEERSLQNVYRPTDLTQVLVRADGVVEAVLRQSDGPPVGADLAVLTQPTTR